MKTDLRGELKRSKRMIMRTTDLMSKLKRPKTIMMKLEVLLLRLITERKMPPATSFKPKQLIGEQSSVKNC